MRVLTAVEEANEAQKRRLVDKLVKRFGEDLSGHHFALWGLAFKPNTDDMREASSRVIVAELTRRGASVAAYDPVAADEAKRLMGDIPGLRFTDDMMAALHDADALLIVTEWKMFRAPDFNAIKASLKHPVILDGRNMYDPAWLRELGFDYQAIGR